MEDQRKVWNNIAKSWNEYRQTIPPHVKDFIKRTHGKLLDLGCGSGRNLWKVRGQELYCVDFSSEMIKIAKETAGKRKINGKFFVMDVNKLEFKDNYFEGVLCFAVLHCIESREARLQGLKEIYRVLKPGGEAFISTWGNKSPRLKNKGKECFIPWTAKENSKEMRYTYVYDLDEFEEDLKEVGFKINERWEDYNVNVLVEKPF
jgi:tRNA (uracil-5-)-methyltransferase TRM9